MGGPPGSWLSKEFKDMHVPDCHPLPSGEQNLINKVRKELREVSGWGVLMGNRDSRRGRGEGKYKEQRSCV